MAHDDTSVPLTDNERLEPLRFVYDLPFISQRKLAIVKLVAKFTVFDPDQINHREFDFLNSSHSLHPLFQLFVRQYRLVQNGAQPLRGNVIKRALQRANETPTKGENKAGKSQEEKKDEEFNSIDWQDFVVLETVEFFSADLNGTSQLSAPFTKSELELQKEEGIRRSPSEPMFKSALTGELIPASQYNEHIKINMLHPIYHHQRAKEQERQTTTNLDTENVAENIARLRQKRRRLLEED